MKNTIIAITCLAFLIILGVVFNDVLKEDKPVPNPGYNLNVGDNHTGFQIGEHYIWKAVEHNDEINTTTFNLVPHCVFNCAELNHEAVKVGEEKLTQEGWKNPACSFNSETRELSCICFK